MWFSKCEVCYSIYTCRTNLSTCELAICDSCSRKKEEPKDETLEEYVHKRLWGDDNNNNNNMEVYHESGLPNFFDRR